MRILFLFLDGVGLGEDDPEFNPFAEGGLPVLQSLLEGQTLTRQAAPFEGPLASLVPLDACLGVEGLPQSATGQAVILTGEPVPLHLGYHYGPKPNPAVAQTLESGGIFGKVRAQGGQTALLNAYPQRYFDAIASGRRLYSAIPLAAVRAGLTLKTEQDLIEGKAISADFTGQGWREALGMEHTPLLSPQDAGHRLNKLAQDYDFSFFEYWLSDQAGHRQDFTSARLQLKQFDQVLGGLLESWPQEEGLIIVSSDHGNLEDLSTRRHTTNPVPALVIGSLPDRRRFTSDLRTLADLSPAIQKALF